MTELTPDAKRLLARLLDVDNPTAQQRASGDAAVRAMLEAQGIVGLPPLAARRVVERVGGKASRAVKTGAGAQRANDVSPNPSLALHSGAGSAGTKLAWTLAAAVVAAFGIYAALTVRAPVTATPAPPVALERPAGPAPAAAAEQAESALPPAPPATARPHTPGRAAAGSSAHARRSAAKSTQTSLSDELKFLASVDAQLRSGGYDHALQRLAQYKGSQALAEERAALRVLALCGRDNDAAAGRARDQFLQSSPSSVLAARVRGACSAGPQP
jgi:hypothetical protein